MSLANADEVNISLKSQFGDSINTLAVSENYAYVGQGQDIIIIDLSDLTNPVEKTKIAIPSMITDIVLSDNYAYIAAGESGFFIVNTSNPLLPSLEGSYDTDGYTYSVAIAGNYAYVADFESDFFIVDISDPTSPIVIEKFNKISCARDFTILDDYIYVIDMYDGLFVIDVSSPSSPKISGNCDSPFFAEHLTLSGNYAYVTDITNGLVVLDVSDPSSPTISGSCDIGNSNSYAIDVAGSYAYIAVDDGDLVVVDISNPSSPFLIDSFSFASDIQDIVLSDGFAYVASYDVGLVILEIEDWNPWNDEDSDHGRYITDNEIQEINYCWINDIPAPNTGSEVTQFRLQILTHYWVNDAAMPEKTDNNAPVFENIDDCIVYVDDTLQLILSATDENTDSLYYSVNNSWGKFAENIFTWEITSGDIGTHKLTFYVSDGYLQDFETITVTILDARETNTVDNFFSSGSSGGYSAGSSGESYDNILYKEAKSLNVLAQKIISYSFDNDENPVVYINFKSLKNAGTVTASVEVLSEVSKIVTGNPPGVIYKNLHVVIGTGNFSSHGNIENCVIGFRVPKSWIQSNQLDDSSVTLYRHHGNEWNSMNTHLMKEDENCFYYESNVPGFSPFAISAVQEQNNLTETSEKILASADETDASAFSSDETVTVAPGEPESKTDYTRIMILFFLISGFVASIYIITPKEDLNHILKSKSKKQKNVCVKESKDEIVVADSFNVFKFENQSNPISYINFVSKQSLGKTTIKVEVLRQTSVLVQKDPSGTLYRNLNIWMNDASFAGSEEIENFIIGFRVNRSWLEELELNASSVRLTRYSDDSWIMLDTHEADEDEHYIYFESLTPGFSAFAIVAITE